MWARLARRKITLKKLKMPATFHKLLIRHENQLFFFKSSHSIFFNWITVRYSYKAVCDWFSVTTNVPNFPPTIPDPLPSLSPWPVKINFSTMNTLKVLRSLFFLSFYFFKEVLRRLSKRIFCAISPGYKEETVMMQGWELGVRGPGRWKGGPLHAVTVLNKVWTIKSPCVK